MSRDTHNALTSQLRAQAETFEEIFAALDIDATYEGQDAHDALHDVPLELIQHCRISVLLTCGGPHVEATADMDDDGSISNARIAGYWGGVTIEQTVSPGASVYRAVEAYAERLVLS